MYYVGIDPGMQGGIVLCKNREIIKHTMMPESNIMKYEILKEYTSNANTIVKLERASSRPGEAVNRVFNYGTHYGILLGFCIALNVQYDTIVPRIWKKYFKIPDKKNSEYFGISLDRACALDPNMRNVIKLKKQNGVLDAYLIAQYCRRIDALEQGDNDVENV